MCVLMAVCVAVTGGCAAAKAPAGSQSMQNVSQTEEGSEEESESEETADNKSQNDSTESSSEIFAMDTYMTVTAYGEKSQEAVNAAMDEIKRLDSLLDANEPDSDLYLANEGGTVQVEEDTALLIEKSLELYQNTKGAYDITVYPLMKEWGFISGEFQVPSSERITELLAGVGSDKINYDQTTDTLSLPAGTQIELGAIAKGYTSSRIMKIFEEYEVTSGMVSLGGNVQVYREKTDGTPWKVAIEHAQKSGEYYGVVEAADEAVITSGGYERYFEQDGKTYHHILNPETGYPAGSGLVSVSIISKDGTLADGLSTSLFVMGQEKAAAYWRANQDLFDAILVTGEGGIFITDGLRDRFSSSYSYTVIEGE